MPSVRLQQVNKIYRSKRERVHAVRDLNLGITEGEFMCLLGPSGCGKTSSLRMIVGLESISSGEIWIGDRLVNDLSPQERNVAMSFESYALYTHLSVGENITFPLKAKGMPPPERRKRLVEIASMLEISSLLKMTPSSLSSGQMQQVSLARALIREPSVFLLDEPLSHLDVNLRVYTRNRIKRLHTELDTTMIYVTHDQLEAVALADRIAVMNFAELQQVGTREELLDRPANRFVADFIGEPPINFYEVEIQEDLRETTLRETSGAFSLPLPSRWESILDQLEGTVFEIGVRPHDITLHDRGYPQSVQGECEIFEFLGEENHLTLKVGEVRMTLVVSNREFFETGEKVTVYLDPNRIHLFSKDSGACLSSQLGSESASW